MKNFLLLFITLVPLFAIPLSYFQFPFFTSKNTRAQEYFIQGVKSFNEMSYEAAKDFFLKALNVMPDFYFARKFLAESYFLSGEIENALDEYEILKNQYPYDEFINYRKQNIENFLIDSKAFFYLFQKNQSSYVLGREIYGLDVGEKNLIPIDIQKNGSYFYILNYESKKILVFNKQGTLVDKISSGLRIQKINRFLIHNNKLYISDFDLDEVLVYNLSSKKFEKSIQTIPFPEILIFLKENLYIWSKKENRFYKYSLDQQTMSFLNIDLDIKNVSEFDFTSDGENIYLALLDKIYKIDISGYVLKTITTNIKKIIKIQIYQNTIYMLDEKNQLWQLSLKNSSSDEEFVEANKINFTQSENFQKIVNFYVDEDSIILCDLYGKIYIYFHPQMYNRNLDLFITKIESTQYPLISIHFKIFDHVNDRMIEDLEHQNFEVFENEKKVFRINAKNRSPFVNRLNVLFLYDSNFLDDDFKFETIFKENLYSFFESFTIGDKFLFALAGDNLKIFYKEPYPIDVFNLMKDPPLKERADLLKNIIQGIQQLILLNGKKCLVLFTNETSSFRGEADWKKILFLSKIYSIPIFVISIKEKNEDLVELSRETGGDYYYFYDNYYYKNIYKKSISKNYYDYIITYEAMTNYDFKLKDRYINVKLKLNYLQMGGYAESGYIIP